MFSLWDWIPVSFCLLLPIDLGFFGVGDFQSPVGAGRTWAATDLALDLMCCVSVSSAFYTADQKTKPTFLKLFREL